MKIKRGTQEFELTARELSDAYLEQEAIYDRSNVEENMEEYLDAAVYGEMKENDRYKEEAAYLLRKYLDDGMSYEFAVKEAIRDTAESFK